MANGQWSQMGKDNLTILDSERIELRQELASWYTEYYLNVVQNG